MSILRALAAQLPSVDRALDDFIARANQTEVAVGDADVIAELLAPDAPAGERAAIDLGRLDAEAREQSLRDQLVGVLDRLADAGAREQSLRDRLAGLEVRLGEAEVRAAAARARRRRWRAGLTIAGAFAAGLAAMLAVSRLVGRDTAPVAAPLPRPSMAGRSDDAPVSAPPAPAPVATPSDPTPTSPAPAAVAHGAATRSAPVGVPPIPRSPVSPLPAAADRPAATRPAPAVPRVKPPMTAPTPDHPGAPAELVDPFAEPPAGAATGSGSAAIVNPF